MRLVQQGQSYPYGYIDRAGGSLILSGVAPVRSQGQTVGYLVDTIDINNLLRRLTSTSSGLQHSIFYDNVRSATTLGSSLLGQPIPSGLAAVGGDSQFGIYSLAGHTYAGYYGSASQSPHVTLAADVDDRVFAAQLLNDALIVLFATTLLATVLNPQEHPGAGVAARPAGRGHHQPERGFAGVDHHHGGGGRAPPSGP